MRKCRNSITMLLLAAALLSGCSGAVPDQRETESHVSEAVPEEVQPAETAEAESAPEKELAAEVEIQKKDALFSGATSYGTDGEHLNYIDEEILIYHNWYGLVVVQYAGDAEEPQIIDTLSLSEIGCAATQGSDAGSVRVSRDGRMVYLYSMEKDDLYRYDLTSKKLYQSKKDQLPDESFFYQLPETMSGHVNWGIESIPDDQGYFVNPDGCVQSLEFVLEGDMVISIWTESSRQYMRQLKEAYDNGAETVADSGWNGGGYSPLVNIEDGWENPPGNNPKWFYTESRVDEQGNWIPDEEKWFSCFENADGSKQITYRNYDLVLYSYQDYLIHRSENNAFYVVDATAAEEPNIEELKEILFSEDTRRLSGTGEAEETAAVFDDRSRSLTFYDKNLSVIKEWINVRVEEFSDAPLCVKDLETGESFYLNEKGERAAVGESGTPI